MKFSLIIIALLTMAVNSAQANFPRNNLGVYDNINAKSNVTEDQFNRITDAIIAIWQPLANLHGAQLVAEKDWSDSTVNAYAEQSGNIWTVHMFGGLARRPEITPDGFALVVCHELGHHFGGYAFTASNAWAASEGQSDYFATEVCAKRVFAQFFDRKFLGMTAMPPYVKQRCDAAWNTAPAQSLCYRSAAGGLSLANLLATLGNTRKPRFETPDTSQVGRSNPDHPAAQCRLDTYLAGAVCNAVFDPKVIPGIDLKDHNSVQAEAIAAQYSCMDTKKYQQGFRPTCWFKPQSASFQAGHWF